MKKMPTLFVREFRQRGGVLRTLAKVTKGCEWVTAGEGLATEKIDGACCAIWGGRLYKRFDWKPGRKLPDGAIPCQKEADPVTGHFPHWVIVEPGNPSDKWFWNAYVNTTWAFKDGTYEAVGPHFQGNPYGLDDDFLEKHGRIVIFDCPRDFDGIKEYLRTHEIEGIVFNRGTGEMCKIKRSDFGFEWPVKHEEE